MKTRRKGIVLMSAMVIAFIMMLWVVAALYRASFQSSTVLFSYRKSEAYYLAKRGISRSLFMMNNNGGWISQHSGRDNADTETTEGASSWVENTGTETILRCEAVVGRQKFTLNVPLLRLVDNDTHIYSVTDTLAGGPQAIAFTTEQTDGWRPLPPLPVSEPIADTTSASNGDVFTVTTPTSGESRLWRYRPGRGWVQMPDLPTGTRLTEICVGASSKLVGMSTDNTLMMLPIDSSLNWQEISPPAGLTMEQLSLSPTSSDYAFVAGTDGTNVSIHRHDFDAGNWSQLPLPTAASFNPLTGGLVSQSGDIPNCDGGIAVNSKNELFVGTNPPGEPSVVYQFRPDSEFSTTGDWRVLPPIPAFLWSGDNTVSVSQYSTEVRDLKVDDEGFLWLQRQGVVEEDFSTIQIDPGDR